MAMANPKRVPSSPGGADGGALHARQDAAQALEQARPDFGGAPGLPDRGGKPAGGRAIEDYDVLADLRRIVAGEGDDACEARVDQSMKMSIFDACACGGSAASGAAAARLVN